MKSHSYLTKIDVLVVRSWLYLISLDELLDCCDITNPELLDILHILTLKSPQVISYSNFEVSK